MREEILKDLHQSKMTIHPGNNKIYHDLAHTKLAFLLVKKSDNADFLSRLYVKEIVRLQGAPTIIVFDRDFIFVSQFWKRLQTTMGTRLNMNTNYHPQTDGQIERMI